LLPKLGNIQIKIYNSKKVDQERQTMNPKCNPVHKKGNRNVLCPYYIDCLDYAIEKSWAYWGCADCQHRLTQGAGAEIQLTVGDSIAYYDLPLEIYREI
jgi:hypothetical protein